MKKKILFVGDHPFLMTGCGNFMASMLIQMDPERYEACCFAVGQPPPHIGMFHRQAFSVVSAMEPNDYWGKNKLLTVIRNTDFDVLCMVGIDIWRYGEIASQIVDARKQKKFSWAWLFPYDLQTVRDDWVKLINLLDFPCVYSEYGARMLDGHVPKIQYFRPKLFNSDLFNPPTPEEKKDARRKIFSGVGDKLIFTFIGANQKRKDPQRLIKAFMEAMRDHEDMVLYLHTEMEGAFFNLAEAAKDYGVKSGDLAMKSPGSYRPDQMVDIYKASDCLINCSMQEGLSWTLIEGMLSGLPIIASDTTAQTELVKDVGKLVPCNEMDYLPLVTERGPWWLEGKCCKTEDIAAAILEVATNPDLRAVMSENSLAKGKEWLEGCSSINTLLDQATTPIFLTGVDKVLFAQHSSAGDVLMSTQCFKGIKERHPNKKLVYMTQKRFQGIVEDNPYLDEIIDWNELLLSQYKIVYNPHGTKILPGGWNNLDVRLHDMYPYFCKVESDEMFIKDVKSEVSLPEEYLIVHSAGGSKEYRTYKHMDRAIKGFDLPFVQIGDPLDMVCDNAEIDLRGKLSWRESAWVMRYAKAAVVIDSFVSHLAGAVGTPAVVLYGPAPARVVGAKGDNIINLEPNMLDVCDILSHCWGMPPAGKKACMSPCINSISPKKVKDSLKELLK